jgi:hypothetical protein
MGGNEPKTFTLEFIGMETSPPKESLILIKVYEGKCKDEIGVSFLSNASCFTMKASGATFSIDAVVFGVRIVP